MDSQQPMDSTTKIQTAGIDAQANNSLPPDAPADFSFSAWFKRNNPLYLSSVLFMLAGLYLVSSEAQNNNLDIHSLLAFFTVQNVYEIIMVSMAIYLLKLGIQPRHGKLLLLFVLLFLGDVTFYQVRISGLSLWYGNLATIIYMILAAVKFAVVIKTLKLTMHYWRIFYVFASFTLIWTGPKISYTIMDSIGTAGDPSISPTNLLYLIWLAAGLIQLPVVIKNWKNNKLEQEISHPMLGNETTFWRYLMIFPFIMMPIQLFINVMADSAFTLKETTPAATLIIPWLIISGFFVEALWKNKIRKHIEINNFDTIILTLTTLLVLGTSHGEFFPVITNYVLVISGLMITWLTRRNAISALTMSLLLMYFTGKQLLQGATQAVNYGKQLSKTAWASILMLGSFIMLGLGFLFSLKNNDSKK